MRYCFDIDGTLCTNTEGAYEEAKPFPAAIAAVNELFDGGHQIFLYTARGSTTGIDWRPVTERQLAAWQVRYHQLFFGKPTADIYIDDKARNVHDWHSEIGVPGCVPPAIVTTPIMNRPAAAVAEPVAAEPVAAAATDSSVLADGRYLDVTYDASRLPYGAYTGKLCRWLRDNCYRETGRLLDLGCGRGEHMGAFADLGFDVAGVDISPRAPELAGPRFTVKVANLEKQAMPYPEKSFDMLFSKSVVEHMRDPVPALSKALNALKPGGTAVVMTPSWVHNAWGPFYIDHTHVTPFTAPSLADALTLAGFTDVKVTHFHQLPVLWEYPGLTPLVRAFAKLPLPYRPMNDVGWPDPVNTFIRFSKEVMLLAVARRPQTGG